VFGSSRQLAIGPTSAISLLVGATVAELSGGDSTRWLETASLSALVVAGLSFLAWLLQLSSLISFISKMILIGFKTGAALTIGMTQLPKLFGVEGGGQHFFEQAWILSGHLGETNLTVFVFGLVALCVLVLGDKFLPQRPIALLVVALATGIMSLTSLDEAGVATVGALPAGLPQWHLPSLRPRDIDGNLPLSAACLLLAYIEGVTAARAIAACHNEEVHPRQELLALGAVHLAVTFFQGFPVTGGLSQSAVNDKAGAKTPLALVFASAALAVCLLFLTDLLSSLPTVVLASIVLVAVRGLIDLSSLRRLWRQPDRVQDRVGGASRRIAAGNSERSAAGGHRLIADAAGRRGSASRGLPRPHPRHAALFRHRAERGQRADSWRRDLPAGVVAAVLQRR
jgi:MFS superfamily sulfate permease-like transporter